MPSAKKSRQQRQAGRVPPPRGAKKQAGKTQAGKTKAGPRVPTTQGRRASPRVLAAVAAGVGVVVVAVVLVAVLTRGPSSSKNVPQRGSLANALSGAADVHQLLKGVPQNGRVLGSPSAPVTMVEYVDLQCPYCRDFETEEFATLVNRSIRPGKVKLEARPVAFIGPDSVSGRAAALAAAKQNHFFDFTQILYDNQGAENTGWLDDAMVTNTAASIPGLDVPKLLADRDSSSVSEDAKTVDALAQRAGVRQTPTFAVGKTGGKLKQVATSSPTDLASIEAAIAAASK